MKTYWVVILSAGLGIALGVGTSWARIAWHAGPEPLAFVSVEAEQAKFADGPQPKVVVDGNEHNFGRVAYDQSVEHVFHLRNEGSAPLTIESGGTTCGRCTFSRIPPGPIAPGETADVVVEYHASAAESDFRQSASIMTNDPLMPRVVLTVTGDVVVAAKVVPNKVVFSRLAVTETATDKLQVLGFFDPEFAIESFELTDPETARFFDVAIQPLPAADVEAAHALRGYELALTIKPGMPLGRLRQTVVLHTNLTAMPELRLPVEGYVDSDISITGGGFDRDSGILTIGPIARREGAEQKLMVLIRGQRRHDVHVKVASCDPPLLQATLGEPADSNAGAVVHIPLVVKIPAGSPPSNHMLHYGKILLDTDHPDAKQLRIWVQFAVED